MSIEAETIQITILDGGGICLQNGDELKRLREVGVLRAKAPTKGKIQRVRKGTGNQEILEMWRKSKGIQNLEHYRRIVGNPRTDGPIHRFDQGMTLTMERCPHPNEPEVFWYVILDTAIGAAVPFIDLLLKRNRVRIEQISL